MAGLPGRNEALFYGNSDGADGSVPAHGQATAGFDEQNPNVVGGVCGRIQDAARHHVVAARLKHQAPANPVELPQKMLPFFAHVGPLQQGAAARDYPDGVATGVGVDAKEGFVQGVVGGLMMGPPCLIRQLRIVF